jgi:plastocyanin
MKFKSLFIALSLFVFTTGMSQTTHTVVNAGFTFSPSTLTIQAGDQVDFDVASSHTVNETDEESFNNLQGNQLPGGFVLPGGGGLLTAADLPIGTHYYYCVPHVSLGMVGIIIVQGCEGDFDGDQDVDISDFLSFNSAFGTSCTGCQEDLNSDGTVDIADFLQFNSVFGSPCD